MEAILTELSRHDRIVVLVHEHADLDSVGSAVGLATALDSQVDVATPSSVKSGAGPLLERVPVVSDPDLSLYDLQVVVDTPSRERMSPLDPTNNDVPLVVIDHHEPDNLQAHASASYVDTSAPATALLVAKLLEASTYEIPPAAAEALAAGLLDDTGIQAVVMPQTQARLFELLERVDDSSTLADLWEAEPCWGERMATAKAIVRAEGYKAGETILLVSRVGGEETAAAQALLESNADIAVVISARGDRTRVVARTSDSMTQAITLPEDVLIPLAEQFGGHGGGHASAGTAKLESADPDGIEESVVEEIETALGMQFGRFS